MAGARMQEIADEAKINKAMLHLLLQEQAKMFEGRSFRRPWRNLPPISNEVFNSEKTVFLKNNKI